MDTNLQTSKKTLAEYVSFWVVVVIQYQVNACNHHHRLVGTEFETQDSAKSLQIFEFAYVEKDIPYSLYPVFPTFVGAKQTQKQGRKRFHVRGNWV